MEVRYLIIARYAEFSSDNKLTLIGGDLDQIVAENFPYLYNNLITVAAKIALNRDDSEREHPFRAIIVDELSNETVAEGAKGTIPKIPFPEGADKIGSGFILPFANVIFPKEGRYLIQLVIDDQVMAKTAFRVAPLAYYQKMAALFQKALQENLDHGSHNIGDDQ